MTDAVSFTSVKALLSSFILMTDAVSFTSVEAFSFFIVAKSP